jgi:UDP-N-acetylmuramoyl-L-alanyl-D-glutamate--2,6-diaminopimelate ligase
MVTLGGLIARVDAACAAALEVRGDATVEVTDLTIDSRAVRAGSLFCCVRGEHRDGHDFAAEAVRRGAVALLVERLLDVPAVAQAVAADTRAATGHLAAAFNGHPSRDLCVVGVTGTTGKTTTAHMLGAILARDGRRTTVLGTLSGARTTPEAPDLQRTLAHERAGGTQAVVMEVSSHALTLQRVAGTRFAAAVFTNLGHDHLDFHRTPDAYFAAKASLFTRSYADRAVINRDDAHGCRIAAATDCAVVTYGASDATDVRVDALESTFTWRGARVRCRVGGAFNVLNALAAATTAAELGVRVDAIAAGLGDLPRIPGRFENVNAGGDFAVLVDYAHTPEALANVIEAARGVAAAGGRVVVVFGCGGDRDAGKRPAMGAAACAADAVVVTSDNPRSEDPRAIIDAILAGVPDARRAAVATEVDRRKAIEQACRAARAGDVVLIAGRGHETMQSVAGRDVPFDDAEVARAALRGRR